MRKTGCRRLAVLTGAVFALALLVPLSASAQVTISHVLVTVGSGGPDTAQYCDLTTACDQPIWDLSGGITLFTGETLVLTQTAVVQPIGGNFDTSDRIKTQGPGVGTSLGCSSSDPCTVTISLNSGSGLTQVFSSAAGNPLNNDNNDSGTNNEAMAYGSPVFSSSKFTVQLGYADDEHSSTCPSTGCFPNPFDGRNGTAPATFFIGDSGSNYDGGVILITGGTGGGAHGCTPGFWKNHATNPPWGTYTPGQTVGNAGFIIPGGIPGAIGFTNETLLDALQGGGGPGLTGKTQILLRQAVAALLNADNGNPPYPPPFSTPQDVINATNAALASLNQTTITNLANTFDTLNQRCDAN